MANELKQVGKARAAILALIEKKKAVPAGSAEAKTVVAKTNVTTVKTTVK